MSAQSIHLNSPCGPVHLSMSNDNLILTLFLTRGKNFHFIVLQLSDAYRAFTVNYILRKTVTDTNLLFVHHNFGSGNDYRII